MTADNLARKKALAKEIGTYTSASFLTQVIGFAAAVLTRKFLGPLQMGVWSLIQVILSYATYTTCGTTNATAREIPYYIGKGETEKAEENKNIVFSFSMATAVLVAAGMVIYGFIYRETLRPEIFAGLIFGAALVILERFNNILISLLRAYKHFTLAGKQMMLSSVVNAALVAVLTFRFQIYGFMWAMFFSFLFNIVYIYLYQRIVFRWAFDGKKLFELILYGFPLMILGLMDTLLLTIDKMVIARFMGLEQLGMYSVAVLASKYIYSFPNAIGVVMIPNFQEQYGRTNDLRDLEVYMSRWALLFCNGMPVLIAGAWFFTPFFVKLFLPDYMSGIVALQYLLMSAFFLALIHPFSDFLITIKKHLELFPVIAATCAVALGLNVLAMKMGWGLAGVAMATTAALFFKFTAAFLLSGKRVYGPAEMVRKYTIIVGKFLWMVFLIAAVQYFIRIEDPLAAAVVRCAVFFVLYLPLLFELEKETGVWQLVKGRFFRKRTA